MWCAGFLSLDLNPIIEDIWSEVERRLRCKANLNGEEQFRAIEDILLSSERDAIPVTFAGNLTKSMLRRYRFESN